MFHSLQFAIREPRSGSSGRMLLSLQSPIWRLETSGSNKRPVSHADLTVTLNLLRLSPSSNKRPLGRMDLIVTLASIWRGGHGEKQEDRFGRVCRVETA